MITLRPANERGHARFGWLDSHHTFSFGNYYDPRHMGVSDLRVINDDWVKPGAGFDTHGHRDMEIITYVLEGEIEHRDTMDHHTKLKAGEVQVMSAGAGVRHSEFNASREEPLKFLQIWIQPDVQGAEPRYAQKDFSGQDGVVLVVSADGRDGSLPIRQDASIYRLQLKQQATTFDTAPGRLYYLQVARGALSVNGVEMAAGDGATLHAEDALHFTVADNAEAFLFDLRG
jgi:quercetin 2,3-dioxygenase